MVILNAYNNMQSYFKFFKETESTAILNFDISKFHSNDLFLCMAHECAYLNFLWGGETATICRSPQSTRSNLKSSRLIANIKID